MLFFSKEEFLEKPLKHILDSFQECHSQLLRHRNVYLQHVKQIIKSGGPWENPVLQGILKEEDLPPNEVEDYLSSELPLFFELRVRYLQACERMKEAKALAKSCLENHNTGKHLFFHQAYLTCLYKASLHEHLHKEMAEIDGRDAVEIICNTESVEKDELLLSMCKVFLTQQLHNGDMYYIWDLVFIWSRLHLRAHPCRQGFLAECLQLASSATNVRAIFPFIKLVTAELGSEGVHVCVELCARALQLCDIQDDAETRSLVCKTIAFLLPLDLEICRACALLVFCQERNLEAYRTVCSLYMHPDQEPHPHNSPVRTSVRFHILQMLKDRLCFDPEFWNLLTLRTHCLELMSDKVMKAAVLSEMKEEEEKEYSEEMNNCVCVQGSSSCQCAETRFINKDLPKEQTVDEETEKCVSSSNSVLLRRRKWRRGLRKRKLPKSDDEVDVADDPEFKYNLKSTSSASKPVYSLRRNHSNIENSDPEKFPLNRKREYLSRCVKSQIFKRKGRKKRWLQGLPTFEQVPTVKDKKVKVKGKKRGRKPLARVELSYPDNEILLPEDKSSFEELPEQEEPEPEMPLLEKEVKQDSEQEEMDFLEQENAFEKQTDLVRGSNVSAEAEEESTSQIGPDADECPVITLQGTVAAVEGNPELDGPPLELLECPVEMLHSYALKGKTEDSESLRGTEPAASEELNGEEAKEPEPAEEADSKTEVKTKKSWRDRALRTQQFSHLTYHCKFCHKDYKGLNVMRHALSHLKSRKLRCILCGKHFKQLHIAKRHILDHMNETDKQKAKDKDPSVEDAPAANGVVHKEESRSQPQGKKQNSNSNQETPPPKSGNKTKVSDFKREDRIIRNLRTLIKKMTIPHKKCKNPDTNLFKHMEFKDEQVVIKEGLVIVRHSPAVETQGGEDGTEQTPGENGHGDDATYHLCPSESCDRVFLRISSTLTKHAIKCHVKEDKVLEKTFVWAKHRCSLCPRQIQFLQHYKDHMKLHIPPLQHFCYHLDCEQRFLTQQELKDHINSHQPFRPQCPFANCENLFSSLQGLYDHEWRHYIPTPQRDELEAKPNKRMMQTNNEAPWKQRVKVEEIWLHSKNGQKESPTRISSEASNLEDVNKVKFEPCDARDPAVASHPGDSGEIKNPDQTLNKIQTPPGNPCGTNDHINRMTTQEQLDGITCQDLSKSDNSLEETPKHEPVEEGKATINGYEDEKRNQASEGNGSTLHTGATSTPSSRSRRKKPPVERDSLNVRDLEDMSTLSEGVQRKLGEPHITEHKTFKPEDPSYATFVKAPFIRPPPSTYLDESVLSMRKRRSTDEVAQRKNFYWSNKKKELGTDVEQKKDEKPPEQKLRSRCDKCLSSFSSLEELQKHQALNTCSSLFGFDSDDES
ncbi:uncharacterized protein V6R79_003010 [Siganus canaliculatus]